MPIRRGHVASRNIGLDAIIRKLEDKRKLDFFSERIAILMYWVLLEMS